MKVLASLFITVCSVIGAVTPPRLPVTWLLGAPLEISVSSGYRLSDIYATGQHKVYFSPVESGSRVVSKDWGVECALSLTGWFKVGSGFYYGKKGLEYPTSRVTVTGNPFEHDFRPIASFTYLSIPVYAALTYSFYGQWLCLRGGPVVSHLTNSRVIYQYDDRDNALLSPRFNVQDNELSLAAGVEYGWRLGQLGLYTTAQVEQSMTQVSYSLDGGSYHQLKRAGAGIRWFVR